MDEIKIEKGIPIPDRKSRSKGLSGAIRSMEIGDSFVVPKDKYRSIHGSAGLCGRKVRTRQINGTDTIRVWRIE